MILAVGVAAVFVAAAIALAASSSSVLAAETVPQDDVVTMSQPVGGTADEGDDDTVDVQLLVLAVVGGAVFVLLPLGYLLRRRLGKTEYTPPPEAH